MNNNNFHDSLNFRDMGGLITNDGRKVKKGIFYRGAGLCYFDEDELNSFKKLNIRTVMDLRSKGEMESSPDPVLEGINNIQHSGLVVEGSEDIDWSPSGMAKIGKEAEDQLSQIERYYWTICFKNEAYRVMLKEIEKGNVPIYFHCASGKDRTGVGAIIIGLLLNVRIDEIKKDYLYSNEFLKEIINNNREKNKEAIEANPELGELLMVQDGVRERTFDIVIDSIFSKYKTPEDYLYDNYGYDTNTLNEIRNRYTVL